jgi:cysteine desulfurase
MTSVIILPGTSSCQMAQRRSYLDWNASAPMHPRAAAAMREAALDAVGNPSSPHREGRRARDRLERARGEVAAALGAAGDALVWTSGGSEADALGLAGLYRRAVRGGAPPRVAVSAAAHPALIGAAHALAAEGAEVVVVAVDRDGCLDGDALARALAAGVAALGLSLVNHELGTIEDVADVAARARAGGAAIHLDAVQALGRVPLAAPALGVDTVAVSGHKIGGPLGVGALWIADGVDLAPLVGGGHQERGRRPGSENLLGAIGFAAACGAIGEGLAAAPRLGELIARLEAVALALPASRRHGGERAARVGGVSSLGFAGAPGDAVVAALDLAGVACSTGAACTSGTVAPSAVLLACGHPPSAAREALRVSMGAATTAEDLEALLEVLPEIVARVRRFSR